MQMVTMAHRPSRSINAHIDTKAPAGDLWPAFLPLAASAYSPITRDTVSCCRWPVLSWGGKHWHTVTCLESPCLVRMSPPLGTRSGVVCFNTGPHSLYTHPHDFIAQAAQTVIHKQIQCLRWCCPKSSSSSSRQPSSSPCLPQREWTGWRRLKMWGTCVFICRFRLGVLCCLNGLRKGIVKPEEVLNTPLHIVSFSMHQTFTQNWTTSQ